MHFGALLCHRANATLFSGGFPLVMTAPGHQRYSRNHMGVRAADSREFNEPKAQSLLVDESSRFAGVAFVVLTTPALARDAAAPGETLRVAGLREPAEIRVAGEYRTSMRAARQTPSSCKDSTRHASDSFRSICGAAADSVSLLKYSGRSLWTKTARRVYSSAAATWFGSGASTVRVTRAKLNP